MVFSLFIRHNRENTGVGIYVGITNNADLDGLG
jgi:hypothetical protein